MKLSLSQKIFALVLIPVALSLNLLALLAVFLQHAESAAQREAHSRQIRDEGVTITHYADNAMLALVQYSNGSNDQYLQAAQDARVHLRSELDRLEALTNTTTRQSETVDTIRRFVDRIDGDSQALKTAVPGQVDVLLRDLWHAVHDIKNLVRMVSIYESRSSNAISESQENRMRMEQIIMWGAIANGLAAFLLITFFVRPINKKLNALEENNETLATLRSPLSAIQSSLTSLKNGCCGALTESAQSTVLDAEKQSYELNNMINAMLDKVETPFTIESE